MGRTKGAGGEIRSNQKEHLTNTLSKVTSGIAFAFPPPAIPGVGTSGGVTFVLQDRSGKDIAFLGKNLQTFLAAARKRPELASVTTTALFGVPQVGVTVDRAKVLTQQINLAYVYQTLQTFMGGSLVNYFNRFGRQWQVYVQADGDYRTNVNNLGKFYVRNTAGEMVPLSTLTGTEPRSGPGFIMRFNQFQSAQLNASTAPGYSSGQAIAALEETFKQTMSQKWASTTWACRTRRRRQQRESVRRRFRAGFPRRLPHHGGAVRKLDVTLRRLAWHSDRCFWCFLALFGRDSRTMFTRRSDWSCSSARGKERDPDRGIREDGIRQRRTPVEASLTGAKLRLRPILMTAFAFILGCVPLWLASGAGGISRQVLGTVVIGGMLAASLLAIFFLPVSFVVIEKLGHVLGAKHPKPLVEDRPTRIIRSARMIRVRPSIGLVLLLRSVPAKLDRTTTARPSPSPISIVDSRPMHRRSRNASSPTSPK